MKKTLNTIGKILSIIGISIIAIALFPIIYKNKDIFEKLKKIFNPQYVTGNTEFRESHESTKNSPKIDIKIHETWKTVDLDPSVSLKKHPVVAVFAAEHKKNKKVEVEITHEQTDRKNGTHISHSALDSLQ